MAKLNTHLPKINASPFAISVSKRVIFIRCVEGIQKANRSILNYRKVFNWINTKISPLVHL